MLSRKVRQFLHDERGSYTIWSLIWFILYVGIGGLAVDGTDAYRNQILLQSTADSAALAGVMSLGTVGDDPKAEALAYAANNMTPTLFGSVLKLPDVHVGTWDFDTETFTEAPYDPVNPDDTVNAVYVVTRRDTTNQNPVIMNMLRIIQLWGIDAWWNVNTEAVAVKYIPTCLTENGMSAWNSVTIAGNNSFNNICVHSQNAINDPGHDYSIKIQNNNVIGDNTTFSQPDVSDFDGRPNVCDQNTGLCDPGVITQGSMPPFDAFVVDSTIAQFASGDSKIMPNYMYQTSTDGTPIPPTPVTVTSAQANSTTFQYQPYHVYNVICPSPSQQVNLSNSYLIQNVVIVANCNIHADTGVQLKNAVVASSAKGNGIDPRAKGTFDFPSGAVIGDSSFCDDSNGQVFLLSSASMHVAAGPDVYGLRMIAGGNLNFTANGNVNGISAVAGGDISTTSNGTWQYCPNGKFSGPFAYYYRLVR